MALLTIQVIQNDGQTSVRVGLRSDCDMMPHEHEGLHRHLLNALLPGISPERERPEHEAVVG